jgi:hypothetical protein
VLKRNVYLAILVGSLASGDQAGATKVAQAAVGRIK